MHRRESAVLLDGKSRVAAEHQPTRSRTPAATCHRDDLSSQRQNSLQPAWTRATERVFRGSRVRTEWSPMQATRRGRRPSRPSSLSGPPAPAWLPQHPCLPPGDKIAIWCVNVAGDVGGGAPRCPSGPSRPASERNCPERLSDLVRALTTGGSPWMITGAGQACSPAAESRSPSIIARQPIRPSCPITRSPAP